jgi:hypothetical protein
VLLLGLGIKLIKLSGSLYILIPRVLRRRQRDREWGAGIATNVKGLDKEEGGQGGQEGKAHKNDPFGVKIAGR